MPNNVGTCTKNFDAFDSRTVQSGVVVEQSDDFPIERAVVADFPDYEACRLTSTDDEDTAGHRSTASTRMELVSPWMRRTR